MTALIKQKIWSPTEIFIFRLSFIFFIILFIPYDINLFKSLFGGGFSFQNLFQLATFRTSFVPESLYVGNNLSAYYNWLIALIIAIIGAVIWGNLAKEKSKTEYVNLYYWLKVALRYRLALAIIFTGIIKLVPIQIPEPTLSDLHSQYGDFLLWKIYYLTNAVASALYVPTLGVLEIVGGLLLLNRRTTTIGAGLLIAILTNIVIVNYVYEIGEQVYSSFLLLLAFAIILSDIPRIYNLLFKQVESFPETFIPQFSKNIFKIRSILQVTFLLVISLFSVLTITAWTKSKYPFPKTAGIANIKGVYNVKEFVFKGDTIPYSLTDSLRWQNVVFEEWNTISIKSNSFIKVDSLKPRIIYQEDNARNYEQLGNGGRHFYRYEHKENNKAFDVKLFNKADTSKTYVFSLEKSGKNEIKLKGVNHKGDSLHVVLERSFKKYLLQEGRRKPIKIY